MSSAPAAGASVRTVVLDPPPAPAPTRPAAVRARRRRLPYGTALVGLLFVTAMGATPGTAEDVFEPGPLQIRPVQVDPAEPPAVVPRTSLRPLHRPY